MAGQLSSGVYLIFLIIFISATHATNYWVDSQSGSSPAVSCEDNVNSIWGACSSPTGCSGTWDQRSRVPQPCVPTPGSDDCFEIQETFVCRRVSGAYHGWEARSGLLHAYFAKSTCWFDLNWFFAGQKGTYEWTALRGDDGSWINIEFTTSSDCSTLK
jgi:hypothetical protein